MNGDLFGEISVTKIRSSKIFVFGFEPDRQDPAADDASRNVRAADIAYHVYKSGAAPAVPAQIDVDNKINRILDEIAPDC
ncbi:hypothetical protein TNCV_1500731 [Trichonephila clavipes]|nr:hypothetical protein TNCV_1500731 [Trichonephila clavipes]